jgi:hypothetical protein
MLVFVSPLWLLKMCFLKNESGIVMVVCCVAAVAAEFKLKEGEIF